MTQYVKTFIVAGAAVASLAVTGVASAAQQHSRTRRPDAPPATQEQSRPQEARPAQPAPRTEQARPAQPAPRTEQRSAPRTEQRPAPRSEPQQAPRTEQRREQTQRYAAPRYEAPRYQAPQSRPFGWRPTWGVGVPYRTPRFYSGPRYVPYYRPYYSFRPRFSIGFGLFLGYSVPYPSWYDPYDYYYDGYRDVRPYGGYAPALGGISFDLSPWNAEVWIDGDYVGIADDFAPTEPPLTLTAGRHHVQLMARGFQTVEFDLTVMPGQVLPYQGTLPRW